MGTCMHGYLLDGGAHRDALRQRNGQRLGLCSLRGDVALGLDLGKHLGTEGLEVWGMAY